MKKFFAVAVVLVSFYAHGLFAVNPIELPIMNGSGGVYKMTDHPEGIFVVEAYFLSCPYCNQNAPKVNALATKYASDPRVQVLDVGVDRDDSSYATWIKKHSPNHPVLKDSSRKLISQLGTSGYPSTYVLNCKGKVVESTEGAWGSEEVDAIEQAIEKLQNEGCLIEE